MDADANQIYSFMNNNTHFCFIKFNDGEVNALFDENAVVSRGFQTSSIELQAKLSQVLIHAQQGYYVGLPCSVCFPELSQRIKCKLNSKATYMNANCLINTNINRTLEHLQRYLRNKTVVAVLNKDMYSNIDKLLIHDIKITKCVIVSSTNAFCNDYDRVIHENTDLDGCVILTMCGPLGRVLCYDWYRKFENITCIEFGSFFDPLLMSKAYSYHTGNHKHCAECYDSDVPIISSMLKYINKEAWYFPSDNDQYNFFNGNLQKIKINEQIKIEKHGGDLSQDRSTREIYETFCKRLNKYQLFDEIKVCYEKLDMTKMRIGCDIYVSTFNDFHDPADVMLTEGLFLQGISNYSHDKIKSMIAFEKMRARLSDKDKYRAQSYLDLFNPSCGTYPKKIHYIYFLEKPFKSYFFYCIRSASIHMSQYEIFIHVDVEPQQNEWWDKTKNLKNVTVVHYERPTIFDDYPVSCVQYAADIARLFILHEHGGIYLDTDMLILKNFDVLLSKHDDFVISTESGDDDFINSIVVSKPGNMFLIHILDSFKKGLRMNNWAWHIRNGVCALINKLNTHYNIQILPHKHFFQFRWYDKHCFNEINQHIHSDMYGIHLFDTINHDILQHNKYFTDDEHIC